MGRLVASAIAWTWMVLAATLSAIPAQADSRRPPPEAVEFYEQAREHYRNGRYREAITELERALILDPGSPTLVFNLARVYELLGELDKAIEHYAHYLQLLPAGESQERERVSSVLQRLRGAQEELARAPEAAEVAAEPAPPPPQSEQDLGARYETTRGVADAMFWGVAGASAVVLVTGAVLGGVALSKDGEAGSFVVGEDGTFDDRDDLQSKADRLAVGADVSLGLGVAAAVAAALLYALRSRTEEVLPSQSASLRVSPTGVSVSWRGMR